MPRPVPEGSAPSPGALVAAASRGGAREAVAAARAAATGAGAGRGGGGVDGMLSNAAPARPADDNAAADAAAAARGVPLAAPPPAPARGVEEACGPAGPGGGDGACALPMYVTCHTAQATEEEATGACSPRDQVTQGTLRNHIAQSTRHKARHDSTRRVMMAHGTSHILIAPRHKARHNGTGHGCGNGACSPRALRPLPPPLLFPPRCITIYACVCIMHKSIGETR